MAEAGTEDEGTRTFTRQELTDLHMVFNVFDASKQRCISEEEARKALKLLGFKVSRRSLLQMLQTINLHGERSVSFEGFLHIVKNLQGTDYDAHEEISQAFELLDMDCDGMLSLDDLRGISRNVGLKMSDCELKSMLEEADKNGDGLVSKEEFVQIMLKTNLFR